MFAALRYARHREINRARSISGAAAFGVKRVQRRRASRRGNKQNETAWRNQRKSMAANGNQCRNGGRGGVDGQSKAKWTSFVLRLANIAVRRYCLLSARFVILLFSYISSSACGGRRLIFLRARLKLCLRAICRAVRSHYLEQRRFRAIHAAILLLFACLIHIFCCDLAGSPSPSSLSIPRRDAAGDVAVGGRRRQAAAARC
jgi:hypothetical protein